MTSDRSLSYYFENNRAFAFLAGKDGKSKWRSVAAMLLWMLAAFFICLAEDALRLEGASTGLLEDVVMVFLIPALLAIVAFTTYLVRRFDELLIALEEQILTSSGGRAAIAKDLSKIREFVSLNTKASRLWNWALIGLALILVLVFQVIFPFAFPGETPSWTLLPAQYPVAFVYAILWALFCWVVVIRCVAWYALSISFKLFPLLRRYSKAGSIRILPLAPDGRGGLAKIGRVSLAIALLCSSGLLIAVPWAFTYDSNLPLVVGFPAYLLFLIFIFFAPLWSVHASMKQAKVDELEKWSKRFANTYAVLPTATDNLCTKSCENTDCLQPQLACLHEIERIYTRSEKMQVWPFDFTTLRQFFLIVIVPFLLIVVEILSHDAISRLLARIFS